jgi:hypothetical protein
MRVALLILDRDDAVHYSNLLDLQQSPRNEPTLP